MRLQLLVLLLAVVSRVEIGACTSYSGYKVYRLYPTEEQLELLGSYELGSGVDIWTNARVPDAPLDVMVDPNSQRDFDLFLEESHIQFETLIADVQTTIDAERMRQENAPKRAAGTIQFNQYYQHKEINGYLAEMAAKHPRLASVVTIGKSTEGRDLNVIKISRGGNNPVIWIDAGIHAREWIAPAMALYVINQLLEVPANSALLDGVDWHILPVVNPDGYQWSHTKDRMWRKTRSKTSSATCVGVDANRNWDLYWGDTGSSDNPCADDYHGPKPFSEPETAAIRDHLQLKAYRHAFYLTLHSYGNYIMYPWAFTTEALPANWKVLDKLAHKASAVQEAVGGLPYRIGSVAHTIYRTAGSSLDWAVRVGNISLGYVVELPGGGRYGFDLPASELEKRVREFFAAIVVFGKHVRDTQTLEFK